MKVVKFKSPVGDLNDRDRIWPKEWRPTKGFCEDYSLDGVRMGFHTGQDLIRDKGTEFQKVYAIADGIVRFSKEVSVAESRTWGNVIVIDHGIVDDGDGEKHILSRYAHLAGRAVKQDEFVDSNKVIGTVGKGPGVAKGGLKMDPHLHFDIAIKAALLKKPLQWDTDTAAQVRAVYVQPEGFLRVQHKLIKAAGGNTAVDSLTRTATRTVTPQVESWAVTHPTKIRMRMTANSPVADLNPPHLIKIQSNAQEQVLDGGTWVQISDSAEGLKGFWVKKKDNSQTYITRADS